MLQFGNKLSTIRVEQRFFIINTSTLINKRVLYKTRNYINCGNNISYKKKKKIVSYNCRYFILETRFCIATKHDVKTLSAIVKK